MIRNVWVAAWVSIAIAGLALAQEGPFDPRNLFAEPVPLRDAAGEVLFTGKALASPYAADYDGDGVNDLIVGAHDGMDTMTGAIWLARNVGTNAQPRFDWKNAWQVRTDDAQACTVDCGCKSAGYVPVQPCDWNGDSWMDLVCTDTYRRAYLLINQKVSRDKPVFERVKYFDFEKTNHGMHAGGGDWNGDGIRDFLYMPFGGQTYRLFRGSRTGRDVKFHKPLLSNGVDLKISGEKGADCAWAWDFSGTCGPGQIEYVGVASRDSRSIDFFRVDDGVSRRIGEIARFDGDLPKVTACDLNADGCMDVLYSGGVFARPEVTKIFVLYGKVQNIRPATGPATQPGGRTAG